MNDRREKILFWTLVLVVWAYVVARAWLVPMVHDECASVLWYVQPGVWMPHEAHLDTNNHLTNSAIGVLSAKLFGVHPFAVRIGSMLAFLVYAWGCWYIGRRVRDAVIRWCLWPSLLLIPFVLDFFSMFRGYALEMAAWMFALESMLRFASSGASRHLIAALACLALATVSMVVLLPAFVVGIGLLALLQLRSWRSLDTRERRRRAGWMVAFGVVPLVWLVTWILRFKENGMLVYGGDDSFIEVTVRSLLALVTGSDSLALSWLVVTLVALCALMAGRQWWTTRECSSPLTVLIAFLLAEVLLRVTMAVFTGANYPPDRTGMHYVPWVLCCFAFAVDGLAIKARWIHWAALPLLALPVRTIATANLDHTLIWPEQSIPARLVERVLAEEERLGRPIVLGSHEQLKQCWLFAAWKADLTAPFIQWERFPAGLDDLRLLDRRVMAGMTEGYTMIDSAEGPGLYLFRRSSPLEVEPIDSCFRPPHSGNDEFYDLLDIPDSLLREHDLLVQVEIPLTLLGSSPGLGLVLEVADSTGHHLVYDSYPICAQRHEWSGETLRYARTIPAVPGAVRTKIYLFNAAHAPLRLGPMRGSIGKLRP